MNYAYQYFRIISNRVQNPLKKNGDGSVETHHIIPKSEGGSNKKDNLVNLTAREHYVCHRLLAKIYDDGKMWLALHRMIYGNKCVRSVRISSKMYEVLKKKCAAAKAEINRSWHPSKETILKRVQSRSWYKHSDETRQKISLKAKGNHRAKGKKKSIEARQKMSAAQKNSPLCRMFIAQHNQKQGTRVIQKTLDGTVVKSFKSIREASRDTGIDRSQISGCCHNKTRYNTAGGFVWAFG